MCQKQIIWSFCADLYCHPSSLQLNARRQGSTFISSSPLYRLTPLFSHALSLSLSHIICVSVCTHAYTKKCLEMSVLFWLFACFFPQYAVCSSEPWGKRRLRLPVAFRLCIICLPRSSSDGCSTLTGYTNSRGVSKSRVANDGRPHNLFSWECA